MAHDFRKFLTNPWLHLALIFVVAAFFRLWQLDSIPPGLFGDEATDGLDALDVLAGRGAVFFPANYGREGLHIWLVAAAFRLLGVTPLALRLPSAIAGILTALATYWLGREMTRYWVLGIGYWVSGIGSSRNGFAARDGVHTKTTNPQYLIPNTLMFVPFLASLYLATSYWHIHFSRFGIRGVFTPLCGALAFAAFWRGVNRANQRISESVNPQSAKRKAQPKNRRSRNLQSAIRNLQSAIRNLQSAIRNPQSAIRNPQSLWFALSGLFLGLATHFYTASRFFPFFLGGFLILQALITYARGRGDEAILRRHFWGIVLLYGVAALVFAPLGVYFLQHPGSFSQRAGEVAAFGDTSPWSRIGQAALANVLQFFVPGKGDLAQFYNLPGRAVFDPLTALLALIGVATLLWRWRDPAALFLLTWFPALLLPAFLATDRFPTLPRVLGVIPGVYFLPAVGVGVVVGKIVRHGRLEGNEGNEGTEGIEGTEGTEGTATAVLRASPPPRVTVSPRHRVTVSLVITAALLVHVGLTYRDYFRVWGPAQATFDAFEGDMTTAWQWLETHQPAGHVYLSSDIYRHPTFMLLAEHATVQTYFQHQNPGLSWFDARGALPLPPPGERATYLIAASSQPTGPAAAFLAYHSIEQDQWLAPDGTPALTEFGLPADADLTVFGATEQMSAAFTEQLILTAAAWRAGPDGVPALQLLWRTAGPDWENPAGYRLEIAAGDWQTVVPFDAFRPPEWVPDGRFVTWRRLNLPDEPSETLRLRLVRLSNDRPVTSPASPDGWRRIDVRR